jgi:hypothetical protein
MSNPAIYKTLYRVLGWGATAGLVLTVALVLRKSPPPNVANDPAAATRVEQKFAAADQAKAAGQPAQVQLDTTELNSYLQQNLQTGGAPQPSMSIPLPAAPSPGVPVAGASADPNAGALAALSSNDAATVEQVQSSVKDVNVTMEGDLVKAHVIFDFHGKDLSLELDGHLGSQDGYMKFIPVSGKLGSLPLPQSMLDAVVSKMMESPENREKLRLPADISDIQVQNGQAVVSYK